MNIFKNTFILLNLFNPGIEQNIYVVDKCPTGISMNLSKLCEGKFIIYYILQYYNSSRFTYLMRLGILQTGKNT